MVERENLREVPVSEILAKIEKGEPVEYDCIMVKGDLDLTKLNLPKRHIDRTELEMDSFGLEEEIAIIASTIRITNSKIQGISDIAEASFDEIVDFSGSEFDGHASFQGSKFKDGYFSESQFNEEALFDGSNFGFADFNGSKFNEIAEFQLSQFRGWLDFSGAEFTERVDFLRSQFKGRADFRGSKFRGLVSLNKSQFSDDAFFSNCEFSKGIDISGAQFKGDVLTFKHSRFNNPTSQEIACRRAKNTMEKAGDREETGYHFYREMEAKRKQKPWYTRYPEYLFIQLIFGYGVRPFRLWACWLIFAGFFAIIYWLGHGIDTDASQLKAKITLIDYIWFSIATAITPGYAGYKPTTEFKLVAGLEAILGTFMWAAFIATFARKYMR